MKSFVLLQKLGVIVHAIIGSGCALAGTYNALKGNYGKAALYAGAVILEAKMVNEHLDELGGSRNEIAKR